MDTKDHGSLGDLTNTGAARQSYKRVMDTPPRPPPPVSQGLVTPSSLFGDMLLETPELEEEPTPSASRFGISIFSPIVENDSSSTTASECENTPMTKASGTDSECVYTEEPTPVPQKRYPVTPITKIVKRVQRPVLTPYRIGIGIVSPRKSKTAAGKAVQAELIRTIFTPTSKPLHPRVAMLSDSHRRSSRRKLAPTSPLVKVQSPTVQSTLPSSIASPTPKKVTLSNTKYTIRILEESLAFTITKLNDLEHKLDEAQSNVRTTTTAEVEDIVSRISAQIGCIDRFELMLQTCLTLQESSNALGRAVIRKSLGISSTAPTPDISTSTPESSTYVPVSTNDEILLDHVSMLNVEEQGDDDEQGDADEDEKVKEHDNIEVLGHENASNEQDAAQSITPFDETLQLLDQSFQQYQPSEKSQDVLELELAHCRMVLNMQKKAVEKLERKEAKKARKSRRSSIFTLFRGSKGGDDSFDIDIS